MPQSVKMSLFNLRIVLLFCFLLICGSFIDVATAQVRSKLQSVSMQDALDQIAKDFEVNFIYESSLLVGKKVTAASRIQKGKKLEDILSGLLEPLSIGYYRVDKNNYALFKLLDEGNKPIVKERLSPSGAVQNETFSISGIVLDRSGKSLEYSTVYLLGNDSALVVGTIADSLGRYKFSSVGSGNYRVRATRIGYQSSYSSLFQFAATHPLALSDLMLTEAPRHLGQVLVSAPKPIFEYQSDRIIINVDGSFTGASFSISDILEISPGIMLANDHFSLKGKQDVTVMIDGSPVKLPNVQLISLLRGIPVRSVSQIELIHSQSARYDAQGKGGIINIKMLANQGTDLSATLSPLFSIGSQPKFTQSAAVNYSSASISLSGSYSYQNLSNQTEFVSMNTVHGPSPIAYQQQETGTSSSIAHSGMLWATYQINRKNNVSFKGTLNTNQGSSYFARQLLLNSNENTLPDSNIKSLSKGLLSLRSHTLNLNSSHTLGPEGHLVSFYADYTRYHSNAPEEYQNTYFSSSEKIGKTEENLSSNAHIGLNLFSFGLDYTYPIGKDHQVEAGGKMAFTHSDSRVLFQYGNPNTQLFTDFSRTNSFQYREKISSAYLNYQGKIGVRTTLQLGLRAETTNYMSVAISGDQTTGQNYTQLFPNFLLSHGAGQQLFSLSYHRSLGRPSYQDFNPFITYFSPYNYAIGNQFLRAETTHSLEAGYSYGLAMNFSLGYSHTDNYLGTLLSLDGGSLSTRQGVGNFGNYDRFNLSANYQKTLLKFWKIGASASLFYDRYQSEYLGHAIQDSLLGFNFNIMSSFQLHPKLTMEVLHLYQSKRAQLAGTAFGRYRADAALKYVFFNERASFRLAVSDIFFTYLDQGTSHFNQLYTAYASRNENRRFHAGLSYVFGTKGFKEKKIPHNQEQLDRIKE